MTATDPGRTAYEARFAHARPGCFVPWADLTPKAKAIWARVEAACSEMAAEAMREAAAQLARTDCRSDFAKQWDVYPEWDSYAIDIARAIRALPVDAGLKEQGGGSAA